MNEKIENLKNHIKDYIYDEERGECQIDTLPFLRDILDFLREIQPDVPNFNRGDNIVVDGTFDCFHILDQGDKCWVVIDGVTRLVPISSVHKIIKQCEK